ncbi:hypothetical protein RF11_07364 [Thelohanellus kitauei]|uniref:Tc1-like transposase DDE domain-containing protein n=1 Tax=Thelohanellus kitauei TaxID=669202 RepID=A0A0C2I619_THEKT|nr:hypothetical protein RF11_07364 [Thelohanellus kitauei]
MVLDNSANCDDACCAPQNSWLLQTILEQIFSNIFHPVFHETRFDIIINEQSQNKKHGIHQCVFIMDNLKFHKTNMVQTMLQENGRMVIYLPSYSPFLNLIEKFVLEMEEQRTNSVPEVRSRPI